MLDATFWVTSSWNVNVLLFYLGKFTCILNWIWSCKGNQTSSSDVSYFIAKSNVPSFLPSLSVCSGCWLLQMQPCGGTIPSALL